MCMFCVIHKWSRRVATLLPWLVIPLIGFWALSQLLPPAFRFEITSPRLACVFVLLVTLFWYEVLMPHLSTWRAHRNAQLRERKRLEALELEKMKKTATRKCRNCLTPYRDQNPGGGKFMCSYCGHISKRPVLDLPVPLGNGILSSGIIKDLWSNNVSLFSQEWLENGNRVVNGSFLGNSMNPRGCSVGYSSGSEPYLAENSNAGANFFVCKFFTSLLVGVRWVWRKLLRVRSSTKGASSGADNRRMMATKGENKGTCSESRGEKARRKAEEKRQARLEKEMREEEERKLREEVARLVEERRRLRDEKIEAENRAKGSSFLKEKGSKKDPERKQREKVKEKDRASNKSNSPDALEKKTAKENESKRDIDRKLETDRRESQKLETDSAKGQSAEIGYGTKGDSANNFSKGNFGRSNFLSTSKAFTSRGFFGKSAETPSKDNKFNAYVDQSQLTVNRGEFSQSKPVASKTSTGGEDKAISPPVSSDTRYKPRASWLQLFSRGPAPPVSSQTSVISKPNSNSQAEVPKAQIVTPAAPTYDNPIHFGFPSPFIIPNFSNLQAVSTSSLPPVRDNFLPQLGVLPHDLLPEEPELFEDPCYEPDPVSLLGPVCESLDNFQLDRGIGFLSESMENPRPFLNVSASSDVTMLSPIERPVSHSRVADEMLNHPNHFPTSPTARVWNSLSLGQDSLCLEGPGSWTLPHGQSRLTNSQVASGACSPQKGFPGSSQNGGVFDPSQSSSWSKNERAGQGMS